MSCPICGTRKPRRHCPVAGADICTVCCATGREETIDCPITCEHLREAHRHEHKPEYDTAKVPNQDIRVTEAFLAEHEVLLAFVAIAVYEGALPHPGTADSDVREALEALIQSARAAQSGLVLGTAPVNPFAAAIMDKVQSRIEEVRGKETNANGSTTITDQLLLGVFAFLQRLEYSHNNGRKRCRAFLDFLSSFYVPEPEREPLDATADLLEPDQPRIIL